MTLRSALFPAILGLTFSAACGPAPSAEPAGPVAEALALAANAYGLPRDLLVAIAVEEGGLHLAPHRIYFDDDHVAIAGHLELRHGRYDSLARGAALVGATEATLVEDTELATRAGAAVLAELAAELHASNDDLASFIPALETLSGLGDATQRRDYARRVLSHLADGGRFTAYAGETVRLDAHEGIALPGVVVQAVGGQTPEFAGAQWIDTSCTGKCNIGRGGVTIDTIVIHDTEGGWDASVATLQNDSGKSVHYIVDADGGRVGQFRPESDITWHSGNSVYNGRSVGIEHVGYFDDPNGFSPGLYKKSIALVQSIRSRNSIPLDRKHIIGHYQVPDGGQISSSSAPCADPLMSCLGSTKYGGASNHRDPGPNWMWCQYMQKLGGSCDCNDAFSHFNCTTDKTQAVRCVSGTVEVKTCGSACVVQATGQDDTCTDVVTSGKPGRNPHSAAESYVFRDAAPNDVPGDAPPAEQGSSFSHTAGCSFASSPSESAPIVLSLLLLGLALALRRRATS